MLSPSRSRYIKRVELLQALTSLLKYVQEDLLCGARDSLLCLTYGILSYMPLWEGIVVEYLVNAHISLH